MRLTTYTLWFVLALVYVIYTLVRTSGKRVEKVNIGWNESQENQNWASRKLRKSTLNSTKFEKVNIEFYEIWESQHWMWRESRNSTSGVKWWTVGEQILRPVLEQLAVRDNAFAYLHEDALALETHLKLLKEGLLIAAGLLAPLKGYSIVPNRSSNWSNLPKRFLDVFACVWILSRLFSTSSNTNNPSTKIYLSLSLYVGLVSYDEVALLNFRPSYNGGFWSHKSLVAFKNYWLS